MVQVCTFKSNTQKRTYSHFQNLHWHWYRTIKILSTTPVSELQFAAKAIVLDSNLNPKKAIETLLQYKINGNEFIGVLDLRDTVKYAFENYESKQIKNDEFEAKHHLLSHDKIKKLTLPELCGHCKFRHVKDSDNLLSVAQLFAIGCHVVGVIDHKSKTKSLVGIITQGYLFQQVVKKWKFNNNCSLKTIFKLKYISYPVFKTMIDNDLSGLAVCDNDVIIIHNTSATDIKLRLLSNKKICTNNGIINGIKYFDTKDNYGVVITSKHIKVIENNHNQINNNDEKIDHGIMVKQVSSEQLTRERSKSKKRDSINKKQMHKMSESNSSNDENININQLLSNLSNNNNNNDILPFKLNLNIDAVAINHSIDIIKNKPTMFNPFNDTQMQLNIENKNKNENKNNNENENEIKMKLIGWN